MAWTVSTATNTVTSTVFAGPAGADSEVTQEDVDLLVPRAAGLTYVEHGATAGTARPSGYGLVVWYGTVEPTNAIDNDFWVDTTA